jgi:hypothetical protein
LQFRDISTAHLEFIRPLQGIFAKLVTKVAKQSSLKVVSLQNEQEIPVGEDREDDQTALRLRVWRVSDQSAFLPRTTVSCPALLASGYHSQYWFYF